MELNVKFLKYHGCGNDFIICEHQDGLDYSEITRRTCNRFTGIGADTFIAIDSKNYRIRLLEKTSSITEIKLLLKT